MGLTLAFWQPPACRFWATVAMSVGAHAALSQRCGSIREGAVRYDVDCQLAGRRFDAVTVDVGFVDPIEADPERLHGPDLLLFAGIAPAEVPAIPLSQHVAEKVHAYARVYGAEGLLSTRVKDLVDLVSDRAVGAA
jgi:hypothetical protein